MQADKVQSGRWLTEEEGLRVRPLPCVDAGSLKDCSKNFISDFWNLEQASMECTGLHPPVRKSLHGWNPSKGSTLPASGKVLVVEQCQRAIALQQFWGETIRARILMRIPFQGLGDRVENENCKTLNEKGNLLTGAAHPFRRPENQRLGSRRSRCSEKPTHGNQEQPTPAAAESPQALMKTWPERK
ncbi:hypothetical protein MJG53_012137 [Ovis ammon polii x Ovis aries]|uniref:Uncharacterized protein n=1 Tax=Ovis ammon polii x Ovis aries TaxID=2918886 RepID=A0ACB9URB1_9CETA|nr:hypothetical protein MJG53_012137 [Ovis ammon polii x Ovis aries]